MIKDDVELFEGPLTEFIFKISNGKVGYAVKSRGQKTIKFWQEKKEKYFLNIAYGKKNKDLYEESYWVTGRDIPTYVEFICEGKEYLFYIEKKK